MKPREHMPELDLTVGILSWNLDEELRAAIASLLEAVGNLRYEAYVVDNHSTSFSFQDIAATYSQVVSLHFTSLQNNTGGLALNRVWQRAAGRYFLLLGSDVILGRETLQNLVRFMDSHDEAGAATAKLLNPDGSPQLYYFRFPSLAKVFWVNTLLGTVTDRVLFSGTKRRFYLGLNLGTDSVTEVDQPPAACLLFRTALLRSDEHFIDPKFPFYYGDVDLCQRIRRKGYRIYLVPTAPAVHSQGASYDKTSLLWRRKESIRSQIEYFRKYYPERVWLLKAIRVVDGVTRILASPFLRRRIGAKRGECGASFRETVANEIRIISALITGSWP